MALTPTEIIAAVFVALVLIKIFVVIVSKKTWYESVVRPVFGNPVVSAIAFLVLAVVVFYYLLLELNIVQIYSVVAFSSLLIALGLLTYSRGLMPVIKKAYSKRFNSWIWFNIILWVALSIWVLFEIFAR